jgi:hypothetical protein
MYAVVRKRKESGFVHAYDNVFGRATGSLIPSGAAYLAACESSGVRSIPVMCCHSTARRYVDEIAR